MHRAACLFLGIITLAVVHSARLPANSKTLAAARCCWTKWGDKNSCGGYPVGGHGGLCSTDWYKKCSGTSGCPSQPMPPPAPPTPPPKPTPPVPPAGPVTVYRNPHYTTQTTADVAYTKTLVHCTDQTDQNTCAETEMVLDVWQPTNSSAGPFPIVMTVHGGAFVSGNQEDKDPPNAYFAERGFITFAVQYRLAKDKGLYPKPLRRWNPKNTQPHAHWTPFAQTMYPAVRDVKAALRWIHAHASEYNGDISSITLQGGSAGATAVIELALTGGDTKFAQDYTGEISSTEDRTLVTANLDQPATATGLIDYWGAIFTADLMHFKDGKHRWSASSLPTIAFHGTDDTVVSPQTGEVLCSNLTQLGVPCKLVKLPGQKHGCWNAKVALPDGKSESIFQHAFNWMATTSNWTVIDAPPVTLTHYGDPSAGPCRPDETVANISGIGGYFCSPSCASGSCPTDRATGVTGVPTCTAQKNCALVCNVAAEVKAGCGPAGNGMSCKPTAGTGYCTYNN